MKKENPSSSVKPAFYAAWSPECWSLGYVRDRLKAAGYRGWHSEEPWLNRFALRILREGLRREDRVLEFGSGSSTIYFARHCAAVISIEHDPPWAERVRQGLKKQGLAEKVDLRECREAIYTEAIGDVEAGSIDLLLIDGIRRADCVREGLPKLRVGGMLILDNVNRYFPNQSRGPGSIRAWQEGDPEHEKWQDLAEHFQLWPQQWTTDGVTDTLILQKAE